MRSHAVLPGVQADLPAHNYTSKEPDPQRLLPLACCRVSCICNRSLVALNNIDRLMGVAFRGSPVGNRVGTWYQKWRLFNSLALPNYRKVMVEENVLSAQRG